MARATTNRWSANRLASRFATIFALLPWAAPASATLTQPLGVERLVDLSEVVLHGDVIAVGPRTGENGRVMTDYVVEIREVFKGTIPEAMPETAGEPAAKNGPRRVVVRVPGGEAGGGMRVRVAGAPTLAIGDERVFMLRGAGAVYGLVGMDQGVWRVDRPAGVDVVVLVPSTTVHADSPARTKKQASTWTVSRLRTYASSSAPPSRKALGTLSTAPIPSPTGIRALRRAVEVPASQPDSSADPAVAPKHQVPKH